jgi:hypothetical protein
LETNILQYSWWSSYNQDGTPFRKNHAGIGYTYDEDRDAFIPKKPFNSWILNEHTCLWEAPVAHPTDGKNILGTKLQKIGIYKIYNLVYI